MYHIAMVVSLVNHPEFKRVHRKIKIPLYHYPYHYGFQKLLPAKTTVVFLLFFCVLLYILFQFFSSYFSVVFPILLFLLFGFHVAIRCFFLEMDMVSMEYKYLLKPLKLTHTFSLYPQ